MAGKKDPNELVTLPAKRSTRKVIHQIKLDLDSETIDDTLRHLIEQAGYEVPLSEH
jgi:hypothetical protein